MSLERREHGAFALGVHIGDRVLRVRLRGVHRHALSLYQLTAPALEVGLEDVKHTHRLLDVLFSNT